MIPSPLIASLTSFYFADLATSVTATTMTSSASHFSTITAGINIHACFATATTCFASYISTITTDINPVTTSTRSLARIRLVLKFKSGTRRGFAKKVITREMVKDEKFLHILLLLADRAWAYYMQLKV